MTFETRDSTTPAVFIQVLGGEMMASWWMEIGGRAVDSWTVGTGSGRSRLLLTREAESRREGQEEWGIPCRWVEIFVFEFMEAFVPRSSFICCSSFFILPHGDIVIDVHMRQGEVGCEVG